MIRIKNIFIGFYLLLSCLFSVDTIADKHLNKIDSDNVLGKKISQNIQIITDYDELITLDSIFDNGVPVVLVMAYYQCPMLCSLVLNGLSTALSQSSLAPGDDYSILTISIDPTETSLLSKEKKDNYINNYFKNSSSDFWTFSTTDQKNIDQITNELGFGYSYDESIDQFAHPAIIYVLTEDGVISKQIFGINPTPTDLKLSILSAQNNQVSSIFDKILLYCYKYDPKAGNYTMLASNVMKIAGASTVLIMGTFLSFFWIRENSI
tara:strand:+ start:1952 stop:2746 length:795 start_codon:yes stop_codon:yes gene_type:complete